VLKNYRFLTEHHIRAKATFDAVFASRQKVSSAYGALRYSQNNLNYPRLGIIISKKNVRLAVARNTLRRILKEQFRLNQTALCGYDIVFVAYKRVGEASRGDFHQCVGQLLDTLAKRSQRRS